MPRLRVALPAMPLIRLQVHMRRLPARVAPPARPRALAGLRARRLRLHGAPLAMPRSAIPRPL
eukprot:2868650-Alexandrium_andersonii.AAC.1